MRRLQKVFTYLCSIWISYENYGKICQVCTADFEVRGSVAVHIRETVTKSILALGFPHVLTRSLQVGGI